MEFTPEELAEINSYYSRRKRDPKAPQNRSEWLSNLLPEIIEGAPSTAGGNFSARDMRDLTEFQSTGQFPVRNIAPELTPTGLPGAQLQGPGPVGELHPLLDRVLNPQIENTPTGLPGAQLAGPGPVGDIAPTPSNSGAYAPEEVETVNQGPNNGRGYFPRDGSPVNALDTDNPALSNDLRAIPQDMPVSAAGVPGLQSQHFYQNVEADRLQGQLNRQRNTASELTGEEVSDDPGEAGMVSKIFDILLRPNYAMAGGVRAQQEAAEENPDQGFLNMGLIPEWFKGAAEGIKGESKETFADVLEGAGVENNVVKGLGGFILDVALDPTTYVGAGLVKGATKASAQAAGAQATVSAALSPAVRKQAAEEVRKRLLLDVNEEGLKRLGPKKAAVATSTKRPTEKTIDKLINETVDKHALEVGKAAEKAALTAGKVQFKLGGKVLAESETLYKGASKLTKRVREMPTVQNFLHKMSPKAEQGDMWQIIKDAEGINVGTVFDYLKPFREMTQGMNSQQAEMVSHAIEGTKLVDDPEILKVVEHVQKLFDDLWDAEKFVGLHVDKQKRANYVYHTFKKGKEQVQEWKKKYKPSSPGFTKERKIPTLQDAIDAGMNPVTDIREIVADRVGKHFAEMTHHTIMMDAIENYGVRLGSGIAGKNWKNTTPKGFNNLESLGKQLDAPLVEFTYRVGGDKGKVTHKALFPEPIADVLKNMEAIKADNKAAGTIMRHLDKVHQNMKFWLTVANPGHHIRNFYGNVFMAYEDGVRNPKRYVDAFHAVRGMNAPVGSATHAAAKGRRVRISNGFSDLEEVATLYKATGTKSGFMDREFPADFASKVGRGIRQLSTEREDIARMGHFLDALKKEAKDKGVDWSKMNMGDKQKFAMNASRRVRKFQLDYGDLTQFEKTTARKFMMFYTFARKNTVLQLEMLATRPGKIARVPQANTAVEQMLGIDRDVYDDDRWVERIPEWIRAMNGPLIGQGGNVGQQLFARDEAGNVTHDPVFATPLLPTSDLGRIERPADMVRTLISEMRPEIKLPLEAAFGTQAFSGAPTNSTARTITQATPITNVASKFVEAARDPEQQLPWNSLASWLGGIGFQRADPQRQASELRRRQQPIQEIVRNKRAENAEEFLQKIREQRAR